MSDKKPKKHFSGKFMIKIEMLANIPGKKNVKSEVFLLIKVDGVQRVKSTLFKSKTREILSIQIDKGYDIEILVYDSDSTLLALGNSH